jgi:hypothetical protein
MTWQRSLPMLKKGGGIFIRKFQEVVTFQPACVNCSISNQPLTHRSYSPIGLHLGFKTIAVFIKDKIHTAMFMA